MKTEFLKLVQLIRFKLGMVSFVYYILLLAVGILSCLSTIDAQFEIDENQLKLEAGCKWNSCKFCDTPKWSGMGILLQKGACIENTYRKAAIPEKGITRAYCTIVNQRLRNIDSKTEELTIDITLTRRWVDPGIKTNFSKEDSQNGGIPLEKEQLESIWRPDVYIYNLSDYKTLHDSTHMKGFLLRPINETKLANVEDEEKRNGNETVVEYTEESKIKIYCSFDLLRFPMDKQNCTLRFGSRFPGTNFVLLEDLATEHKSAGYKTQDFNIKIKFVDNDCKNGMTLVGFDIEMERILKPYIMEYYLPCMASVLVSQIGFLISLKSIPGRAALLVTQFLSLINLFIAGMVSSIKFL